MKSTRWTALLALLALACSASRATYPPQGDLYRIAVHVENDLTARSDVTVRMVASTGASSLLGGVPPGQERSFEYRERLLTGSYALTASTGDGRLLRSRAFTLFPGAAVLWSIQLNDLRVVEGSGVGR